MELLKLSSNKIKFSILWILLILVIGNNSPVYAVIYHFEEDFSGGPDEDWKFSAWFYPPDGNFTQTDHTFTFDDELVSGGTPNRSVTNYAVKNDTTAFGAWSFDIYIPINPQADFWGNTFSIGWDYLIPTSYYQEPGGADFAEFSISGIGDSLKVEVWNKTKDPSSGQLKSEEISSVLKFNTTQNFDVIRTLDKFYVFIDGDIIMNTEFSSNFGPEINYFSVVAAQGSGVKFDNIKITTDAQGVLDSLNYSGEADTGSSTSSESNNSFLYATGFGIVVFAGSISYWQINKKKT